MLSVIIITKNEEGNIRRCLESVKWADEIIVLDSGSRDKTVDIAKEFTDKVYLTDWRGYGIQKQRALSFATGDWVLNLDADEAVDEALKQEIEKAMMANSADAFRIPIRMYFYGKPLRYSSSPTRHVRLFKRKGARYSEDIVHEKIMLAGGTKIEQFKNPLIHHSYRDLTHALHKINVYSSYSAKIRIQEGRKTNFIKVGMGTGWMFFRTYILQRGFLDGYNGLIFALLNTMGTLFRGLKQIYPDRHLRDLPVVSKETKEAL